MNVIVKSLFSSHLIEEMILKKKAKTKLIKNKQKKSASNFVCVSMYVRALSCFFVSFCFFSSNLNW